MSGSRGHVLKCSDYAPDDNVRCRICGNNNPVKTMPKTKTGFRFVCKPCLHKKSLENWYTRTRARPVPMYEAIMATQSVLERATITMNTSLECVSAGSNGNLYILSGWKCTKPAEWDRVSSGQVSARGYYVFTHTSSPKTHYVHRLVCEAFFGPSELPVNHIDGNPLNNALYNLEYVTSKANHIHASLFIKNKKKAYRHNTKGGLCWYSRISKDGQDFYLGSFGSEQEAVDAYDKREKELFGEYFEKYKDMVS